MEQSESTLGNQRKQKASISHYFLERSSSRNIKIVNTKYKLSLRIGVFSMSNSLLNLSNFFLRIFLTFYLPSLYENALVSPILSPSPKSYCSFKLISFHFWTFWSDGGNFCFYFFNRPSFPNSCVCCCHLCSPDPSPQTLFHPWLLPSSSPRPSRKHGYFVSFKSNVIFLGALFLAYLPYSQDLKTLSRKMITTKCVVSSLRGPLFQSLACHQLKRRVSGMKQLFSL